MRNKSKYEAVVIGASAGGLEAIEKLLTHFPSRLSLPIIVVQHLHPNSAGRLAEFLSKKCKQPVKEADEKEQVEAGTVYFAPANYHLLIENNRTFTLSVDEKVNYCRPSIDVMFESAAEVYKSRLIGIILTGANNDGSYGLKMIKASGGLAVVQDPKTAVSDIMPKSAIETVKADAILPIEEIAAFVMDKVKRS